VKWALLILCNLYKKKGSKMSNQEILAKVEAKRSKCIVYTRVMGYHRPVESFNIGKKGEHGERKQFIESARCVA
jgi:hypothetical protein